MPSFQHIQYLYLLLAIPFFIVLYFYALNWKKKTAKKIGDEHLVKALTKNYSPGKFALKFLLLSGAFAFCTIALANLRKPGGVQKVNRNGIDVMIALDVSKSMLAEDIKPTRLERAKQVIGKLIDKLGNDRIGFVLFAGKAYMQMPLTSDYGAAKMYLATANTDVVPTQGTVIGEALKMCYRSFNTKEKKYKSIVLISDGEDHEEEASKIAAEIATEGVIINTVGIGSLEGIMLTDFSGSGTKKDKDGNPVISKLNETVLKDIALNGKGLYQFYNNSDEVVANIVKQLSSMDQRTVAEDSLVNYTTYFQWFLLIAFLLLIADQFIGEKKRTWPIHKKSLSAIQALLFFILCLGIPLFSASQSEKTLIKKGNTAYKKNDYEQAAQAYKKVIDKKPDNKTALFNYGNARYKTTKIDDAIGAYNKYIDLSTDKIEKAKAYYNKGVVYQNAKNLNDCIQSYKNALKLNPGDEDARQNLQKALQQQKREQKKEQENKKKNKPKEDPNKKEKEKPKDEEEKNNQPKPQPSKINKQDAEEKLKALLQQEKNLQDKLKKIDAATTSKPEKDW